MAAAELQGTMIGTLLNAEKRRIPLNAENRRIPLNAEKRRIPSEGLPGQRFVVCLAEVAPDLRLK